ncbi:MAG: ATP-binding cassette domain-containing protein [Caldilineaceae bacterium]|nr:ATP-binding cassette domain-containing protein [Caldilineaceae bacterium]
MRREHGSAGPLLEVQAVRKYFPVKEGLLRRTVRHVKAVDGVDLTIGAGETLGLVGESGCGKTTLGRMIVRVFPPTSGSIFFREGDHQHDLTRLHGTELKAVRRHMQMIFQDPFSSLNPRMTALETIGEPLLIHGLAKGRDLEDRVAEMMEAVGLKVEHLRRYPHSFSGGQRQRLGIARALILNPSLVVCDEPVSALDVSVQAQVINLLQDLQRDMRLTYLFVAHDLSVVRHISDRVAVMYVGKVVEAATTGTMMRRPLHPYTEALLSAVPRPDPHKESQRILMDGEIPDPSQPPPGCIFHTRCRYREAICVEEEPELVEHEPGRFARCHFAQSLTLQGVDAPAEEEAIP